MDAFHGHEPPWAVVNGIRTPLPGREPTGRQVREAAGAVPADEYVLILARDGGTTSVGLDEAVDLRGSGPAVFRSFLSDRAFMLTVDGRGFEWGAPEFPLDELRAYAGIPPDYEVLLDVVGGTVVEHGDVHLGGHGSERVFTRPRGSTTIVINGRRRTVSGARVSFEELVALAFATPPIGNDVQFTVQSARGPADRPSGTLVEGQSVKVREGMEFDVTSTNRS